MEAIRLTVNQGLKEIINRNKQRYPALSDVEIIKVLISKGDKEETRIEEIVHKKTAQEHFKRLNEIMIPKFKQYVEEKGIDYDSLDDDKVLEIISNA